MLPLVSALDENRQVALLSVEARGFSAKLSCLLLIENLREKRVPLVLLVVLFLQEEVLQNQTFHALQNHRLNDTHGN
jgi:hypothetical protein